MGGYRGYMQWYDYLIFSLTLGLSLAIGIFFAITGNRQRSTGEFLTGNRRLPLFPVAMSMFMSTTSAIIVLGSAAESYQHGLLVWPGCIMVMLGSLLGTSLFVPVFYPLKITSVFEYYEMRFNSVAVRRMGAIVLITCEVMYLGLVMYSPAVALEAVTNIPLWISILSACVVGTVYTSIGGIKAVIWTDTFQGIVFFTCLTVVLIAGVLKAGGATSVFNVVQRGGRLNVFEWDADPTLRLNTYAVGLHDFCVVMGNVTSQHCIQRICATKSLRHAQGAVLVMVPMLIFVFTLTLALGLVCYAYYEQLGCDPLLTGQITSANQVLPFFIVDALRIPCLPGLMLAVLFSGALSSFSSSLSSCSAVTYTDFLERRLHGLQENRKAVVTKLLVLIYGILGTAVAFMYTFFGGNFIQISGSLLLSTASPLFGMVVLGTIFPCANWIGTLTGAIVSFVVCFGVGLANNVLNPYTPSLNTTSTGCSDFNLTVIPTEPPQIANTDIFPLFRLSFALYSPLGLAVCISVGLLVSLLTGKTDKSVDPRLFVSMDRIGCCLPKRLRHILNCGSPGNAENSSPESEEQRMEKLLSKTEGEDSSF